MVGKTYHPPVNYHGNGKSPCSVGNTSSTGPFSIAMLVYQRVVSFWGWPIFMGYVRFRGGFVLEVTWRIISFSEFSAFMIDKFPKGC